MTDPNLSEAVLPQTATNALPPSTTSRAKNLALLACLGYVAFDLIVPLIPVHLHGKMNATKAFELLLLALVPTGIFMLLQVWLSQSLVALRLNWRTALASAFSATLLWFAVVFLIHPGRHLGELNLVIFLVKTTLLGLLLTIAMTAFGTLLARIIREPNVLMPAALIAMPVDYIGAMTNIGFTHNVEKHAPSIVHNVSVSVPAIGGLAPIAVIGPGDALFMAFFFAVVQNLKLNERGTFWWIAGLLTLAMFVVLLTPLDVAALVPMGLAVLIANQRYFHLKRDEIFAVFYAILISLAAVIGFYLVAHRYMFHGR